MKPIIAVAICLLLPIPAVAEQAATSEAPPKDLAEIRQVCARFVPPQPIPGEGLQCQADMNKWTKWETLGAIMAIMLRRSGFPLATPNGPRFVDPPFPETWPPPVPDFVVEATLKLQESNPPEPTCTIAIRAELRMDEHSYWSSKIILTEAKAGKDERTRSKDIHLRTRDAMWGLAEQFMADWIAAGGQRAK